MQLISNLYIWLEAMETSFGFIFNKKKTVINFSIIYIATLRVQTKNTKQTQLFRAVWITLRI